MPIFFPRSAAWSSSVRSDATASVSSRRSAAVSSRSSDSVPIAPRLRGRLRFLDRLLGDRVRALAQERVADEAEDRGEQDEPAADDQKREPDREGGRQSRRGRREPEAEREEGEQGRREGDPEAGAELGQLLLELGLREVNLEPHECTPVLGYALRRSRQAEAAVHAVLLTTTDGP